jgi:hypothetical protein
MTVSASRRRRRRDPAAAAAIVGRWRSRSRPSGDADLVAAWSELGADGAGAVPTRVSRNGVVTVACRDAMRAQQISSGAEDLLDRLRRLTGAPLTRLDTVIADHAIVYPVPEAPPQPPPLSDAALRAADEAAAGMSADIEDPDVRDAVARAAARAIARSWERSNAD